MSRTPLRALFLRNTMLLTGGRQLFSLQGSTSEFKKDLFKAKIGSHFPVGGNLMYSASVFTEIANLNGSSIGVFSFIRSPLFLSFGV
jgi:hypothetical protein